MSLNGEQEYILEFDARPDDMPAEAEIRDALVASVIESVRKACGTVPAGVALLLDRRTVQVTRLDP